MGRWAENRNRLFPGKKKPLALDSELSGEEKSFTSGKCYKQK